MKRLLLTLLTAATVAAPIALSAQAANAQGRWDRYEDRHDRWDRRGDGWDRRGDRWDRHDNRGWDRGRHNGYYYRNQWYYGPPPVAYYGAPYYRPGYSEWRRGAYLPPAYRGRGYIVYDYERYRLRPPPRGYSWYRVDDGYMLAAITSGLIYDIIRDR